MLRRILRLSCILLPMYLAYIANANAQVDPLGGLAVGAGLKVLGDKINEAIEKAVGGGEILEIGAGGQIALAIQQAQTVFDHEKELTFRQLQPQEQALLNSLTSTANSFLDKTFSDVSDLEGKAQAIVIALPFSKTTPQVVKYSPHFAAQGPNQSDEHQMVEFVVDGSFADAANSGFTPELVLKNGKRLKSEGNTLTELTFRVPLSELQRADAAIATNRLQLVIPHKKSFLLVFTQTEKLTFDLPLAILPKSFGVITVTTNTTTPVTVSQPKTSPPMSQESVDDDIKCGGEHGDLAIHTFNPDPGWTVDPNTVALGLTRQPQGKQGRDGDWWLERNCSTPLQACLCLSTEHHRTGTSGKVWFVITFSELKPGVRDSALENSIPIIWEDNRVFVVPPNSTWRAKATFFDGTTAEFAGPFSHKWLSVSQTGNTVSFHTIP